ncbi:MAG: DUF924 domain-containing protein [Nannocystis sp.]|nr:DUF924 family protein [Nannocystis sp.]MBA3548833.1 DUF924 domain-containing protein [Nannocystis sp.]
MPAQTSADVLDFWFAESTRANWFVRSEAFDALVRAELGPLHVRAARGELDAWAADPRGALALVILLDQVPRNIHRGSANAFASDARALQHARAVLDAGLDRSLSEVEKVFLYLPFEHSEAMADQDRSVTLMRALADPIWRDFAEQHRVVIARFGRFPHRNAILGRESSPEELEFLQQPGSSF